MRDFYIKLFFIFWVLNVFGQENYSIQLPEVDYQNPMVFIQGGEFIMGSPKVEGGHFGDEGPQHRVTIAPFWMSKVEITWDLYNLFVSREIDQNQIIKDANTEVSLDVDAVSGATTPYVEMSFGMGIDNYPAICMTQLAAVKFCEWLSAMTGHFYRLPTEAEWEYAARAGSTSSYSFGDDVSELMNYAWFKGNSNDKYQKVGTKKPNDWGLHDMHGNVAEWTSSAFFENSYNFIHDLNPDIRYDANDSEPNTMKRKVIRGGSWKDIGYYIQTGTRHWVYSFEPKSYIGFRCVSTYLGRDYRDAAY